MKRSSRRKPVLVSDPLTRLGNVHLLYGGRTKTVAFSPSGKTLAAAGEHDFACLWNVETGEEIRRLTAGYDINTVAFSPDGELIAIGVFGCFLFRVRDGKLLAKLGDDLIL